MRRIVLVMGVWKYNKTTPTTPSRLPHIEFILNLGARVGHSRWAVDLTAHAPRGTHFSASQQSSPHVKYFIFIFNFFFFILFTHTCNIKYCFAYKFLSIFSNTFLGTFIKCSLVGYLEILKFIRCLSIYVCILFSNSVKKIWCDFF